MGKKRNTKSTMTITNTCRVDPPLYTIGKTFTVLLQIEFYIFVFFLWLCINERNAEIKTTGFLPLVACLTFWNNTRHFMLAPDDIQIMLGKNLNCQHMGAIRWITNNKGNTPCLSQTPSRIKHGTTLQRSSTGIQSTYVML